MVREQTVPVSTPSPTMPVTTHTVVVHVSPSTTQNVVVNVNRDGPVQIILNPAAVNPITPPSIAVAVGVVIVGMLLFFSRV